MDWRKTIGAVAPTILRAIGGPVGGVAANILTTVLGVDANDEQALAQRVQNVTPDDLLKLKQADQQFAKDMKGLDLDLDRIEAEDRANARAREIATKDWLPKALAIAVHVILAALIIALFLRAVPDDNRDALNILLGTVSTGTSMIWAYYFGSSAGSRAKDVTVSQLAGKK